jgi:alpha-D-xyloside xylohydrolase
MIGSQQTGSDNEIWSFGDEQYEIIRRLLFLRERLRPYVMAQMRVAHETGLPPMRPLFLDFPGDPVSWEVEDQFLFGGDVLVAPVCTEGARERRVYLPAGPAGTTVWRDAWSGAEHEGGQWITAPAPLELIPVYLRAGGAVEPFGSFADLAPADPPASLPASSADGSTGE